MSSVLGLPKSVPSQDTLLDSPRCFVLEKPTAKSGRATEAVSSAGVVSGKTNLYQFVTPHFLQVLMVSCFLACGSRALPSINQQNGAVSRVTVGGFLSYPGSFVASYQSTMGPGLKRDPIMS